MRDLKSKSRREPECCKGGGVYPWGGGVLDGFGSFSPPPMTADNGPRETGMATDFGGSDGFGGLGVATHPPLDHTPPLRHSEKTRTFSETLCAAFRTMFHFDWAAANGGVTDGRLRGAWPPCLEISLSSLFALCLPFSPFSGGPEQHLGNAEHARQRPFSSDILGFAYSEGRK